MIKGMILLSLKGVYGAVFDENSIEADIHLVRGTRKIMQMYKKQIDPFTKNLVSKETYERANKINELFTALVLRKILTRANKSTSDEVLTMKMKNLINISIDDLINPVNINGKKIKLYNLSE